jgi:hypothetical protein
MINGPPGMIKWSSAGRSAVPANHPLRTPRCQFFTVGTGASVEDVAPLGDAAPAAGVGRDG